MKSKAAAFILCLLLTLCLGAVCRAEVSRHDFDFFGTGDIVETLPTVEYDPDWFDQDSTAYNHKLAQLSISMAAAAFRDTTVDYDRSDHYLRTYLEELGFRDYRGYGYEAAPAADTISNGFAWQRLQDSEGSYVLLAVPICGQGYGDEWLSNFRLDEGTEHAGFTGAAKLVEDRMADYVNEFLPGERIKVWITGFSRAAAVSNLVGSHLLSRGTFAAENVFVYTFGTPAVTTEATEWPQIYNIVGSFDPVPKVPLIEWGYQRNGVTLTLPSLEGAANYEELQPAARRIYEAMRGDFDSFDSLAERNWLVTKIIDIMYRCMPDIASYSQSFQQAVINLWTTGGGMSEKLEALLATLEESNPNLENMRAALGELVEVASVGISDTLSEASGNGGTSLWVELLSSGLALAHEHFTEEYIAWIFATDDMEELFGHSNNYNHFAFSGDLDFTVTLVEEESETLLYDVSQSIDHVANMEIENQAFLFLPLGRSYRIELTVRSESEVQFGYFVADVFSADQTLLTTETVTMQPG